MRVTVHGVSDAQEPGSTPILASDAEREHSILLLRDAVGEGRLTLEEFSDRVDLVQVARTDLDLSALTRDLPARRPAPAAVGAEAERHSAVCAQLTRRGPWSLPQRSSWRSIFGTIDLDLSEARLESGDTLIEVYNLFGTVTVLVPDGADVSVCGGGLFASQKIESPQRPAIAAAPRITIATRGPGGTLHVRTRPRSRQSSQAVLEH